MVIILFSLYFIYVFALVKHIVGGELSVGFAVRDVSWGSLRNSFHRLKRRINPHQSNRSRATNNLVHKSDIDIPDRPPTAI